VLALILSVSGGQVVAQATTSDSNVGIEFVGNLVVTFYTNYPAISGLPNFVVGEPVHLSSGEKVGDRTPNPPLSPPGFGYIDWFLSDSVITEANRFDPDQAILHSIDVYAAWRPGNKLPLDPEPSAPPQEPNIETPTPPGGGETETPETEPSPNPSPEPSGTPGTGGGTEEPKEPGEPKEPEEPKEPGDTDPQPPPVDVVPPTVPPSEGGLLPPPTSGNGEPPSGSGEPPSAPGSGGSPLVSEPGEPGETGELTTGMIETRGLVADIIEEIREVGEPQILEDVFWEPLQGEQQGQELFPLDDTPVPLMQLGPGEITPSEEPYLIEIGGLKIPLAAPPGYNAWALLNLILSILGVAVALVMFKRYHTQRKREQEEEDAIKEELLLREGIIEDEDTAFAVDLSEEELEEIAALESGDEIDQRKNTKAVWLIGAAIVSVAAIILFVLTQDMSNPWVLVDKWTVVHAVLFAAEIAAYYVMFKKKNEEDEDGENPEDIEDDDLGTEVLV